MTRSTEARSGDRTPAQSHVFEVSAIPSAQTLMRVLGFFAQQDLVPEEVVVRSSEERMTFWIAQRDLDDHRAHVMIEKICSLPYVEAACLTCRVGDNFPEHAAFHDGSPSLGAA